jgi:CubicO group peptidase (beta-lactamase class C family)
MRILALLALFAVSCAHVPYERIVDDAVAVPLREKKFAGAVLVMVDGKPLVRKAYGFDNTPGTRFMIMSVSKQFTAALIIRLVAKGKLALDDRAGKYLEHWPAEWDAVTIHSLLSHSSGLDIDTTYFWLVKHHPEYWAEPGVTPPPYEPKALLSEPGTAYKYANVGYTLLSMIAARAGGKPFDVLMREEVFEPLRLKHTEPERDGAQRARGHEPGTLKISEQKTIDIVGSGDLVSTVDDLARFDRAFEHDRFLPADLRQRMRTPYVRTSAGIGIGYGWFIHDGGIFGHNGSGGGFRAFNYTIPAKKLIVVVLSNVAEVDVTWVRAMVDKLATSAR